MVAPTGIAYDYSGNLYFADASRHQVFEATLGGQLLLVAGNGTQGDSGDGGPATAAQLNNPQALAIAADGTIYIADTDNHRIRAVISGTISTIAGSGALGFSGDNGPATMARLASPTAIAVGSTGMVYVADSGNHRIRSINTSGVITTIAGNGTQGFSGDGGPATSAALDTPSGLAVSSTGQLYIADTHNHRVRSVSPSGTITNFAGTGSPGYSGDNAAATAAQLDAPRGLVFTASGALLIADANNHRVRAVSPSGTITTVAGSATQGSPIDATSAVTASLSTPRSVGVTSFGNPVLADTLNRALRILATDGNLYSPAALSSRTSTITVLAPATSTFGQTTATVAVSGTASTPLGSVQLMQNNSPVASATLVNGSATFPLLTLSAGSYSLSAAYTGDGINPAATSPAIALTVARASSSTTTQPPVQNTYASLPLLLNASVTSTTKGTPTGSVNFVDASSNTTVASAQLTNGIASGVYLAPTAGTHAIAASYLGDTNFAPSTSPVVSATVQPLPDFTVASIGTTTQTVTAGFPATYNLAVAPVGPAFTGAVSMAVTGLPFGATAAFAPPQLVPGAASTPTTLTIQTLAPPVVHLHSPRSIYALGLVLLPFVLVRKSRRMAAFTLAVLALTACGTRVNQPPSASAGIYNLTVSATSTNLAGATVVHTTSLTLNVR